ncbi:serine/threonine-protein kinase [Nocardia sp. NPDC059240]|uniref:serine/threonine-protein kinase n=1 Tax=Nocardia sp. NPDC059240 TaxID=3346786 RepID=UPI0036C0BABB
MSKQPVPGEIIAGYRIVRVLGRGGMGTVYLAAHPRLPRHDALKVMAAEYAADFEFGARFVREAELVAQLEHPNIVPVHDRGVDRGCLWIAMGFVDGIDAAALIRQCPGGIAPGTAVHVVTEVARGLDAAHRAGVLHRDVKPANILLERHEGRPDRVFITDFGIARPVVDSARLTETGTVVATVAYAAPELLTEQAVDQRADVYALGCTLYELLTGATPFAGLAPAAVVRAHLTEPPPRPSARNPVLPTAFDEVIGRALAKDPQHRYDSCGALAEAAAAALSGWVPARHPAGPDIEGGAAGESSTWRQPEGSAGSRGEVGERDSKSGAGFRRRAMGLAVVAVVAVVASSVTFALTRHASTSAHPPAPTTVLAPSASAPPTSTTVTQVGWGAYEFMVQVLPGLLPPTPLSSGFAGLRCVPIDEKEHRLELTAPLTDEARLQCSGNGDPVDWVEVMCTVDHSALPPTNPVGSGTVLFRNEWQHGGASGRLIGGTGTGVFKQQTSILMIDFDDDAHSSCDLTAWGAKVGQDLVGAWWNTVPL